MPKLALIRHGQSAWNLENRFTGWWDADLTAQGEAEARASGQLLAATGADFRYAFTSVQTRAIRTLWLALTEMKRAWIPVEKDWHLNERHYGGLTGLDKAETKKKYGDEQLLAWRRGYATPPPVIEDANPFNPNGMPNWAHLPAELVPKAECLADVVVRMLPYWYDGIVPDLQAGHVVLVAAHGNSLRALVKHLDGIGDDEITGLDIPTGQPIVYELGDDMRPRVARPIIERYLGDPEAIRAAAEAVKRQVG